MNRARQNGRCKGVILAFAMLLSGTCIPSIALAQVTDNAAADVPDTNGEILVTAQKRVQVAREVPLALSAIDPQTVERLKIDDVSGLASIAPGISTVYQGLDQPVVVVRGITSNSIGIGGESSVGFFIDDAYNGRLQALSVPFLDVERIEVLRGPQGSLYGRNSTAGAISVVTNKPRFGQTSAEIGVSYGSFKSYDGTAVVNLPISDAAAMRIALLARGDGGYDRNITTGKREQKIRIFSGRASFAYQSNDTFTANLALSFARERAGGLLVKTADPALAALGGVDTDPFSGKVAENFDGFARRNSYGVNLALNYEFSDSASLKSVTSYNRSDIEALYDVDGSVAPLQEYRVSDERIESLGQELRLSLEAGRFRVLLGGNAFFEWVGDTRALTYDENVLLPLALGTIPADALGPGSPSFLPCDATSVVLLGLSCSRQTETIFQAGRYLSLATFLDAEVKLSNTLTLIAGGRYSSDVKRFVFNTPLISSQGALLAGTNPLLQGSTTRQGPLSNSWTDFQPRAVLRWQPTELLNIYGSVTRGFKSGGFDPSASGGVYDRARTQFEPESVWSYELGLKAALFNRLIDLNLAGYRYTYRGFQAQVIVNGITSTLNGPSYNAWGAEGDLTIRPGRMVNVVLGGAYNGAKFGNFRVDDRFNPGQQQNLRGNRGIVSPEYSAFARADAAIPISDDLRIGLAADVTWQSRQFFTIYADSRESQSAYALVGAQIALKSANDRWSVAVNARNVFNKDYLTFSVNQGFSIGTLRGRPRSVSVDLRAKF
jgi:iron complex outermembrane recepter protein